MTALTKIFIKINLMWRTEEVTSAGFMTGYTCLYPGIKFCKWAVL
jgi:hypothetical protein